MLADTSPEGTDEGPVRRPWTRPVVHVSARDCPFLEHVLVSRHDGTPSDDTLRLGTHNGHMMVAALKRHRDKPVMFLGDTTLTGGEVAERISQYVQAFEALDAGRDTPGALLALNRPEVLFILGAGQTQGYRRTSLHPLGSLDDHAYVLNDAEITTLIIDPVPMFVERALGLLEKVPGLDPGAHHRPGPRGARARRQGPRRDRRDLRAAAARGGAAAARPHRLDHLHRRHHRQAQGRDRHRPGDVDDDAGAARRVGVAGVAAVPDVHAAVARRRGLLRADGDQGRLALRAAALRPGRGAAHDRGAEDHRDDAGAVDALRTDGPPRLAARATCRRSRPSTTAPPRSTRCGWRRRSSASDRSSPSTTASPRHRW